MKGKKDPKEVRRVTAHVAPDHAAVFVQHLPVCCCHGFDGFQLPNHFGIINHVRTSSFGINLLKKAMYSCVKIIADGFLNDKLY